MACQAGLLRPAPYPAAAPHARRVVTNRVFLTVPVVRRLAAEPAHRFRSPFSLQPGDGSYMRRDQLIRAGLRSRISLRVRRGSGKPPCSDRRRDQSIHRRDLTVTADLKSIIDDFAFLDDWEDRYRYVIELGRSLPDLPEEKRTADNKVQGCASQVWLVSHVAESGADPVLTFEGESDAHIVRGLVAIVLAVYSATGRPRSPAPMPSRCSRRSGWSSISRPSAPMACAPWSSASARKRRLIFRPPDTAGRRGHFRSKPDQLGFWRRERRPVIRPSPGMAAARLALRRRIVAGQRHERGAQHHLGGADRPLAFPFPPSPAPSRSNRCRAPRPTVPVPWLPRRRAPACGRQARCRRDRPGRRLAASARQGRRIDHRQARL